MSRALRDGVWARALLVLGLCALVVAGCGSGSSAGIGASARAGWRGQADPPMARHPDLPPIPSEPAPVPPSLMATVAVPNLAVFAADLAGYLNAVQPELLPSTSPWVLSGTLATLLGTEQVAGLTHEAPLWFLALRRAGDSESSWLAVLPVVDTAALAAALADDPVLRMQMHGGYAAIGTIEALRLGAGYALSSLIHTRPPGGPGTVTATVHMPAFLRSLGPELSVMAAFYLTRVTPGQSGATLSDLAIALIRLADQADEVRAELAFTKSGDSDKSGKRATLSLAIDGRPASTLALFAETQSPASFAALDALPLGSVFLAAEGNLDAIEPLTQPVDMSRWRWIYGDDVAARMEPLAEEWRRLRGGRVALTGDASPGVGVWVTMLLDVTDEARAGALIEDWMHVLHGAKTTLARVAFETVCTTKARRYRGVPIAQMTLALGAAVPETIRTRFAAVFGSPGIDSYLAAGEGGLVWSLGSGAMERLETVLDRVRRPRRSRGNTAAALAMQEAKARAESLLLGVDVAQLFGNLGLVPLPAEEGGLAVFGVGFAGRTMTIRLTAPASAVRAAAHALGRR